MDISNFENALSEAISAIVNLREEAETLKDELDNIIESCETIENEL